LWLVKFDRPRGGRADDLQYVAAETDVARQDTKVDKFYMQIGVPGVTRTPDPQFRKLLLYPAELRGRCGAL
jgi:hypothetical protein